MGKARTRPNILRVSFGSIRAIPCEASEQKLGQKPKSELKEIERSYCHHSIIWPFWAKIQKDPFFFDFGLIFGGQNQKSATDSKCKIHIYIDSETFRQIHRKM